LLIGDLVAVTLRRDEALQLRRRGIGGPRFIFAIILGHHFPTGVAQELPTDKSRLLPSDTDRAVM
jgi:hypothetical protein